MKKNNSISAVFGILAVSLASLALGSCSQSVPTLNAPTPTGSFTYTALTPTSFANPYTFELISTSQNAMGVYWDIPGVGKFTGDTVKVTTIFAGSYVVKMVAAGPGGLSDTVRQTIAVNANNPYGIDPNSLMGILTGANLGKTQRTWQAARVVNSCVVAPGPGSGGAGFTTALNQIDGKGGAWWGYGTGDIATNGSGRDGYLDDQYTFIFGNPGSFIYNDNNTVYLDQGGSGWTKALPAPWNSFGGTTSSTALYALVPALKPWGSGTFSYSVAAAPAGAMKLGTLTVNGIGAHMGLQDKNNSGEVTTPTGITSITYDVLRIQTDLVDATSGIHYDLIITGLVYDGNGDVWTFIFRADR